jgi:predicted NACHT family NTPase
MSLNYRLFPDRIRRLFGSMVREEKDLDHWHYDMMGQTMLIRNCEGDYTPAHRSLLEFFVAYKFAAELGALASDFTELAQAQSHLDAGATPQNYTWSSYFRRRMDEAGKIVPIAPLKAFASESLAQLRQSFGQAPLTKAVMDLIVPMLEPPQPPLLSGEQENALLDILEATRGKTEDEVGYVGGNAATLLVKVDKGAIAGKNLSHTVILGADFTNASLCHANFTEANLANSVFTKDLGHVLSVAFNAEGKLLATGDSNGMVCLWEAATGRKFLTCKGHKGMVTLVAFSPSGEMLASGSYDRTIRLWDIRTGECLQVLQGHSEAVFSVAFSPSGEMLARCSYDQIIRLWDIRTGECLAHLQGHTSLVKSVAFSPSGEMLASASGDKTVRLWNVRTGECLQLLGGHTSLVRSVALGCRHRGMPHSFTGSH